ncbi:MAG: helix-turn-helix domain-containing protein [Aridibacter sp.]
MNNLQFLDMNENTFGKWLNEHRTNARLSQQALGDKTGMSKQYISVLERGEPHALTNKPVTPAVDIVDALAKALDRPIDEARLAAGYAGINSQTPEP